MTDMKTEVEEEEETYMKENQLCMKEAKVMVTVTKEEPSLGVSTGKYYTVYTKCNTSRFYLPSSNVTYASRPKKDSTNFAILHRLYYL